MPRPKLLPLAVAVVASCARQPAPDSRPSPIIVAVAPTVRIDSAIAAQPVAISAAAPVSSPASTPAAVPAATGDSNPKIAEVTRSAVAVFGDSVASDSADDESPKWDIDVRSYETQERVAYYVRQFTGSARGEVLAQMERGTRYEPMIRAKLRAAGLPEDMTYLAMIESGYYPHAYSRAAAVGMWQLMTSTARGAGLRVDWWVDERRDPVRSTDAAISFLRYLRDEFGSLYLAAAAYNGGPGRVSRGLTRYADDLSGTTGDDVFFVLAQHDYLRAETRNYVPQLIAAALISKDANRYGFTVRPQPMFAYDSVRVPAVTPIAAVARAAGATIAEEIELNPELLRGATPPGSPRWMRVPVGRESGFDSAFAALPQGDRTAFTKVSVTKKRSLDAIAEANGVSTRQLAAFNPKLRRTSKGLVAADQVLLIPTAAVAAASRDVPDPGIERYGSSSQSRATIHVVKKGESLERIAKRYKTSAAAIKRLNHLRKDAIFPGQPLVVKGSTAKSSSARSSARSRSRGASSSKGSKKHVQSSVASRSRGAAARKKGVASRSESGSASSSRKRKS